MRRPKALGGSPVPPRHPAPACVPHHAMRVPGLEVSSRTGRAGVTPPLLLSASLAGPGDPSGSWQRLGSSSAPSLVSVPCQVSPQPADTCISGNVSGTCPGLPCTASWQERPSCRAPAPTPHPAPSVPGGPPSPLGLGRAGRSASTPSVHAPHGPHPSGGHTCPGCFPHRPSQMCVWQVPWVWPAWGQQLRCLLV